MAARVGRRAGVVEAAWATWDDPAVDWAGADLVAVRATWDYQRRLPAWRDWVARVEKETRLLNGGAVFDWNTDKAYLETLGEHVPVVPSELVDDEDLVGGLQRALDRWGSVVVKPRIGAGGVGVVVIDSVEDDRLVAAGALNRQHDGTGQLRGITVLPSEERRGLGRLVSTALTRRALAGASGTASLGVYTDNAPAIRLYERLGYRTVHTFRSAVLA